MSRADWSDLFDGKAPAQPMKRGRKKSKETCSTCGLDQGCHTVNMKPHGKNKLDVVWVGEAPGEAEDELGKQWQGRVGRSLRKTLSEKFDFDLFRDAICINSVNCRPPNNDTPDNQQIACCRKNVMKLIHKVKPKLIVTAGACATTSVIGDRWPKKIYLNRWRGFTIPDRDLGAWVCPVFHQSYIERTKRDMPQVESIYLQDLERALDCLDRDFPRYQNEKDCIDILFDEHEIAARLVDILRDKPEQIAFDYETTGLKPYAKGHKIVCIGIATSKNRGFVFPMPRKKSRNFSRLVKILQHPDIPKMAHNIQYEDTWSRVLLGTTVRPWLWDSMVAAHIQDNRKGITGLKFQSFVQFGIADYASEITPFLEGTSKGKGINKFNKIMDLINKEPHGEEKLMMYCGMDALLEYRLAMMQMKAVKSKRAAEWDKYDEVITKGALKRMAKEFEYRTEMHFGGK